ncbi:hypothetical protein [Hymenobacter arizonensis]|uniref:Uncharacterized protein n=1 Tax=Hymenobacter arizonensis TaxID=1227077 RepID=A0A1I5YXY4_HYMAR|nr:hypothetical protein [Hymenobacter arizonensis]SFQ49062.1 hypothetical protein SAMN04515668_2529 [Hymenobacter arizonensis]
MSDIKTIEGFLTLKKDGKTVLDSRPSILTIDAPSDRGYLHAWHLDNVVLPADKITLQELEAISDKGIQSEEGRFDVLFAEDNSEGTYTGQAFIAALVYDRLQIDLRGATELAV